MRQKIKYLSKNVLLFSISSFVPKLLTFLLVPLYTNYLSTNDYGLADLITTTATLLIPIFTLDIQDAVLRFSMDKNTEPKDVFSIAMRINIIGLALLTIICIILYITNILSISYYFYFFIIVNYLTGALTNSFNLFCRGINKVKTIVFSSIINSSFTLGLNITFLVALKMGLLGFLLANSIGNIIALIFTIFHAKLYKYLNKKINKSLKKEMINFSFPLIFSVIAWWINSTSDRYILTWICGVSINGIYAIAYKIPSILTVFSTIFNNAWSISSIKEFDREDKDGFIGSMYTLMNFSMCVVCSIIMIFNILIAKILYAKDFIEAWHYVPPLLLSVVFNSMALFIGSIFTAVKDTKTLSASTIIGATTNIILNIILIPRYNAYGAAIATMISYLMVIIIRNNCLKKHICMRTNQKKNYLAYIILIIQMVLAIFGNKVIYLQVVCLMLIIYLYKDNLKRVLMMIKGKIKSIKKVKGTVEKG